jgi:hypothetical protein
MIYNMSIFPIDIKKDPWIVGFVVFALLAALLCPVTSTDFFIGNTERILIILLAALVGAWIVQSFFKR